LPVQKASDSTDSLDAAAKMLKRRRKMTFLSSLFLFTPLPQSGSVNSKKIAKKNQIKLLFTN